MKLKNIYKEWRNFTLTPSIVVDLEEEAIAIAFIVWALIIPYKRTTKND